MYEITVSRTFAAAHAIRLPDGSTEPLHGHNWTVDLTAAANELGDNGLVMDFHELERLVDDLLAAVNNRNLNDTVPFKCGGSCSPVNPTAERVAWWLGTQIAKGLPSHVRLSSVCVGEAPGCTATYHP